MRTPTEIAAEWNTILLDRYYTYELKRWFARRAYPLPLSESRIESIVRVYELMIDGFSLFRASRMMHVSPYRVAKVLLDVDWIYEGKGGRWFPRVDVYEISKVGDTTSEKGLSYMRHIEARTEIPIPKYCDVNDVWDLIEKNGEIGPIEEIIDVCIEHHFNVAVEYLFENWEVIGVRKLENVEVEVFEPIRIDTTIPALMVRVRVEFISVKTTTGQRWGPYGCIFEWRLTPKWEI